MAAEESLRSKNLYRVLIITLKYIPMVISLMYMINTILSYFYIDTPIISNIAGMSLLSWLFIYLASTVFRFCQYHKMFLYYILVIDFINIIDYYLGIPIGELELLMLHSFISGVFLFLILYFYVKSNRKTSRREVK